MTFVHLGDLHLGRSLGEFDLIGDQEYILQQVIDLAVREHADAVLVAGDIYDRAVPSEAAVRLLDRFLCDLTERGIGVFLIAGNHDSEERLNFGSRLLRNSGVYVAARYEGQLTPVTLTDAWGPVHIWLLPFVKASLVRHWHEDADIENYDDALGAVLDRAGADPRERNVLVAHQFVTAGGDGPSLGGSESLGTRQVGLVEQVSASRFDAFDYVALGHIHSPQAVGRETVRYAGSPLKYSLSEALHRKSAAVVTLQEKGRVDVRLEPLVPRRDLRHLQGPLKQLIAPEHVTDPEDFIYATLTDEVNIPGAMSILQQIYPNTVRLDYLKELQKGGNPSEIVINVKMRSFPELITDFYKMMYGEDISPEEKEIVLEAAREVHLIHEAD